MRRKLTSAALPNVLFSEACARCLSAPVLLQQQLARADQARLIRLMSSANGPACLAAIMSPTWRMSVIRAMNTAARGDGILVLNRVKAHKGHSVLPGIERMKERGKFELDLSADTVKFIKKLEDYGAEYRYYEVSYDIRPFDIVRFDRAVWELRRYCQPLDYDIVDTNGKTVNLLTHELDRVHRAKAKHEKGTCVMGGILEKIIEDKNHPARDALIWNNLFVGPSRRKGVKMRPDWEAGNSPFFLHPEIIDEVVKYVYIPKDITEGVRQFAKQKATEKAKAERDAKKAANFAAKQSGKMG